MLDIKPEENRIKFNGTVIQNVVERLDEIKEDNEQKESVILDKTLQQHINKENLGRENLNAPITKEDLLQIKKLEILKEKEKEKEKGKEIKRYNRFRVHDKLRKTHFRRSRFKESRIYLELRKVERCECIS